MFSLYMIDKILFINMVCFSFLTFVFVLNFSKTRALFRLLGAAFFAPFLLAVFSYIFLEAISITVLLLLVDISLALILLLLVHKYNEKRYGLYQLIILLLPILLCFLTYKYTNLASTILSSKILYIVTALIFLADIFYSQKNKTSDNYFVQAVVCMLGALLLRLFRNNIYVYSLSAAFSITAYTLFFLYFYKIIYGNYTAKLAEVEKLKATVEKTLNYEVKKRIFEVEKSNEQLLNMAKTDHLTKAYNKIAILNIIENLINSKRDTIFSILMFDIDLFKQINDTHGHVTGDVCLKTLANIARGNIRSVDYLGRYGGDEFVIVLPGLSASEARFVAERFRKRVMEGSDPVFTISIGIACYPEDGMTVKDLISSADKGLYRSKHKGKNAVSHAHLF